jgi:hypothetical protein
LVLVNGLPIEIEANGSYYNPADLMSMGYWAWSEKIALLRSGAEAPLSILNYMPW